MGIFASAIQATSGASFRWWRSSQDAAGFAIRPFQRRGMKIDNHARH